MPLTLQAQKMKICPFRFEKTSDLRSQNFCLVEFIMTQCHLCLIKVFDTLHINTTYTFI